MSVFFFINLYTYKLLYKLELNLSQILLFVQTMLQSQKTNYILDKKCVVKIQIIICTHFWKMIHLNACPY